MVRKRISASQQIADINRRTAEHQIQVQQNAILNVASFLGMTPRGVAGSSPMEIINQLQGEARAHMRARQNASAIRAMDLASVFYRLFDIDPIPADVWPS